MSKNHEKQNMRSTISEQSWFFKISVLEQAAQKWAGSDEQIRPSLCQSVKSTIFARTRSKYGDDENTCSKCVLQAEQ